MFFTVLAAASGVVSVDCQAEILSLTHYSKYDARSERISWLYGIDHTCITHSFGKVRRGNFGNGVTPEMWTSGACNFRSIQATDKRPTHDRQHCPAKDVKCRKCGKKGHYQAVCSRSARVSLVDTHMDTLDAFLGAVGHTADSSWSATVDVNETPIELHIDTGAELTVISEQTWRKVGQPALSPLDHTLRGPDTHQLPTTGRFTAKLSKDKRIAKEEIYVVKGLHKPLLGCPAIDKLGLVWQISSVGQTDRTPADRFPKLFEGLGKLQGDYIHEGWKNWITSIVLYIYNHNIC